MTGIILHFFPTPNGRKVGIALEEMGLPYTVAMVDILKGEQQRPEFQAISPNGRIPALVDETGDERVVIFESGAILQYLARKTGRFYGSGEAARAWIDAWVHWQMAGLGPMTGQVTFFRRASAKPGRDPREMSYAIHRFEKEMRRLYDVLDAELTGRDFIGDGFSIADMAIWPWVHQHHDHLGDLRLFPAIDAWHARILRRAAVARALLIGADAVSGLQPAGPSTPVLR